MPDDDLRQLVKECLASPPETRTEGPTKRVFLLGDSHALNIEPSLAAAVRGPPRPLRTLPPHVQLERLHDTPRRSSPPNRGQASSLLPAYDAPHPKPAHTRRAQVHGDAVLRILTATDRGFLHPFTDKVSDDFQTGECGEDMTGSTQVRSTTRHPASPHNLPLKTKRSLPFYLLGCAQRYREAAVAALDASVTAGDVVVIHNFWKGEEEQKEDAHFYEEVHRAPPDLPLISAGGRATRAVLFCSHTPSSCPAVLLTALLISPGPRAGHRQADPQAPQRAPHDVQRLDAARVRLGRARVRRPRGQRRPGEASAGVLLLRLPLTSPSMDPPPAPSA